MPNWDTFEFFEMCLITFKNDDSARTNLTSNSIDVALKGFSQYADPLQWKSDYTIFVNRRMDLEYSEEKLEWYEECKTCISLFASYVFGVLIAYYHIEKISETDMLLAEVHLPGFILNENERICDE